MGKMGLLIDYEWCSGCHSCEMACQIEHGYPIGQTGILLKEVGPWQIEGDRWQYAFVPVPTNQCDQCPERTALGKKPACVHHCQAACMEYGNLSDLAEKLQDKSTQVLFAL